MFYLKVFRKIKYLIGLLLIDYGSKLDFLIFQIVWFYFVVIVISLFVIILGYCIQDVMFGLIVVNNYFYFI